MNGSRLIPTCLLLLAGLLLAPGGAAAKPPSASASAQGPLPGTVEAVGTPIGTQGDLGFVRLAVNNKRPIEVFPAFIDNRERPFLEFNKLMKAIEVPVTFDASLGAALGYLADGTTRFNLNLERSTVVVGDETLHLKPDDYRLVDQTLYVRYDIVPRWIPLRVNWSVEAYQITIHTRYTLPSKAREQRKELRQALERERAEAPTAAKLERNVPWFDAGQFELDPSASGGHNNPGQAQLTLKGVQRFLKGDLEYSVTESHSAGQTGRPRLDYGRLTWYNPLRTWQVQLGDTFAGFSTLLMDPVSFRGGSFYTGGEPQSGSRTSLIGTVPPGSEVDLYRQGVLLDTTTADSHGFYRFQSVPLTGAINMFELHIYTPSGHKIVEYRRVAAAEEVLPQGAFASQGGAGTAHQATGSFRLSDAEARYGLLPSLTVGAYGLRLHNYLALYETIDQLNAVGALALWRPLPWLVLQGEQAHDSAVEGAGTRMDAYLAFNAISLQIERKHYTGDFAPPNRTRSTDFAVPARVNTEDSLQAHTRAFDTSLDLRSSLGDYGVGRKLTDHLLRADRRLGSRLSAFLTLERKRATQPDVPTAGADDIELLATYALSSLSRLETNLQNLHNLSSGTTKLQRVSWIKNALVGSPWSWQVSLIRQSQQANTGVLAAGYLFPHNLRLSGLVQTDGTWLVQVAYALPFRVSGQGVERLPDDSFGRAGLEGTVYVDSNANGRRDPGEPGVPGVQLLAPGMSNLRSDAKGHFRGWGLPSGTPEVVDVNLLTADALDTPAQKHQYLTAHPGEMVHRDIALVPSSGMDGTIRLPGQRASDISPADGLPLLLLDKDRDVVARSHVEWDGGFIFEHIPPGTYTLEADAKAFAAQGLELKPRSITIVFPPRTDPVWRSGVVLQLGRIGPAATHGPQPNS